MKVDLLAFGAHPDDVELGCAGTIALSIAQGKSVVLIDLTQGELGTRGSVELRRKEATVAASILGVQKRENLKFKDGFFVNDEAHQRVIIKNKTVQTKNRTMQCDNRPTYRPRKGKPIGKRLLFPEWFVED